MLNKVAMCTENLTQISWESEGMYIFHLNYMYFPSVSIPRQVFLNCLENVYIIFITLFGKFRYIPHNIIVQWRFFCQMPKHVVLVIYSISGVMA